MSLNLISLELVHNRVEGSQHAVQKKHILRIYAEHVQFGKTHIKSEGSRSLHRIQGGNVQMHNKALLL